MCYFKVAWRPRGCEEPGARAGAHSGVHPPEGFPSRSTRTHCRWRRRAGWKPDSGEPGSGAGGEPGSQRARAMSRAPRRPYRGWTGLLGRERDNLSGSIERRLLVRLPLEHRELQLVSGRWGPGPFHGRQRRTKPAGSRRHTPHPRVQSPKLPPGWLALLPRGWWRGGERETSGGGRGQGQGRLFFWFVQGAACAPFPVRADTKQEGLAGWPLGQGWAGMAWQRCAMGESWVSAPRSCLFLGFDAAFAALQKFIHFVNK